MTFLLGYEGPDGVGGYAEINADRDLDAVRSFREWFGYAFRLVSIMNVTGWAA